MLSVGVSETDSSVCSDDVTVVSCVLSEDVSLAVLLEDGSSVVVSSVVFSDESVVSESDVVASCPVSEVSSWLANTLTEENKYTQTIKMASSLYFIVPPIIGNLIRCIFLQGNRRTD